MGTDARKHTAPASGEAPRRQAINDLSLTVNDIVPVANATERGQIAAQLTDAGFAPSAARPLYVSRADASAGAQLEYTTDGTTWHIAAPYRGLLRYSLPTTSSGFTSTAWSTGLGSIAVAGTAIRVKMSGRVNTDTAGALYTITVRDGSGTGTVLCSLAAMPPAVGGPGQVTWTAEASVPVSPGNHNIFLAGVRTVGAGTPAAGTGSLQPGFNVLIDLDS
jgi:hypothetical protein